MRTLLTYIFTLFLFSFFVVSCGSGTKKDLTSKYPTIYDAIRSADTAAVKDFIRKNPSLLNQAEPSNQYRYTPLVLAITCSANAPEKSKNFQELAEMLISKGADVNAKVKDNETPLTIAAANGQKAIAEALLAKGADINATGLPGWTPLHHAVLANKKEMVELLISRGAKVDTRDANGCFPLHSAAAWGFKDIAGILIAHGAEPNALDNFNKNPLDYAIMKKNKEMAAFLRAHGGKENSPTAPIDPNKVNKPPVPEKKTGKQVIP
ncbi:MAG: ankyrin repeat domain-containing protein [Vulcanimicrobiota bacterium]